jgi:hypothetical protein
MSAPTKLLPAQLVADLTQTLSRLRKARTAGDYSAELVLQRRLDWLIDKLPRKDHP